MPAIDDFFNTHTRLAKAIVSAVQDNSEIKVIGLLGRWGSGKSTVANKIVEIIEAREDSSFRIFTYDAWLHQSDPLRRSFLESLIGKLVEDEAIAKRKWTKELEKLGAPVEDTRTIETPVLSHDARLIGLSLLAVPVGLGLLGLDTLKEAFGEDATALGHWTMAAAVLMILAPALVWTWLYLKRRQWKQIFNAEKGIRGGKFWRMLDENGEDASALQIFVDGQAKHTTTQTFRSIEPTSLEFGRMFQDIMREAAEGGDRLIILIDNLDRVAAEEALGMWATIRSFFLASHETEDVKHESFHPTVILPIDRHAVEELFAGGGGHEGGRDRARSFMDKTFDVTFEVTEPVNSDWREFLVQQMKGMFEEAYEPSWGFWTRRMFESQLVRQHSEARPEDGRPPAIVTPREINKLLNRIGTLYLQWASAGIPVEVMALYVIRREEIDRGLLTFLQSAEVEIAEIAPQWRRELAALHYGVEPEKAAQVLLEDPIRSAIVRRDETEISALSPIPGFGEIFEYATANLPEPTSTATSFDILANAVFLLQALDAGANEWAATAWRNLASKYIETAGTATATLGNVEIVKLLSEHVAPEGREAFILTSAEMLSRILAQPRRRGDKAQQAADGLILFASSHDLPPPLFALVVDPQVFVARLSELATSPRIWPQLRTNHDGEALTDALSDMLGSEGAQRNVPTAIRCLRTDSGGELYSGDEEIDFEALAQKADQLVRQPGTLGGDAMSGVRVLAELSYGRQEGRDLLIALVDEGLLATRLDEVVAKSDWPAVAEVIAILLWRGHKFSSPTAFSWYQYGNHDPDHLQRIVLALRRYFPGSLVPILWGARKANVLQSTFFEAIIGHAVATDALGRFDTKPVLGDLLNYKLAVPYRMRDKFLDQVDRQSNFLEALEDGPLGPQIVEAASYLRRKGGENADRADAIVRSRVEEADAATWTAAIRSGQEPYGIGQTFLKSGDLKIGRRSGLFTALHDNIPAMLQIGGREMRGRWFKLVDLMKPKDGKALLRTLGEALGDAPPAQALHVLKTGGVQFLKTGAFVSRANQSVRTIILPQLERKDGRDWLKDNKEELAGWVQRADPKIRNELRSELKGMLDSKREERRYTADILATKWGLKLSS